VVSCGAYIGAIPPRQAARWRASHPLWRVFTRAAGPGRPLGRRLPWFHGWTLCETCVTYRFSFNAIQFEQSVTWLAR